MKSRIGILALAAALAPLCGCSGTDEGPGLESETSVPVRVERVELRSRPVYYEAVGTVRSRTSSLLSSHLMGQVLAVHVKEGQRVRPGQLLVEIDSRDARARLEGAQAALQEARAARGEVNQSLEAARSSLDAAGASAHLAQTTYQRYSELLKRKSVSQQEFDEVEARFRSARAERQRALAQVQATQQRQKQVEARIERARAGLAYARIYLSYTRVTAPSAGVVASKQVDVGDLASPGAPLLRLEDSRHYRLEAQVDESRLQSVKAGQQVPVRVDSLNREFDGRVVEVVPLASESSRSFTVKIELPPDSGLRSGMFGRARFQTGSADLVMVPAGMLIRRGQLTGLLTLEDGRARYRLVKTGRQYGDGIEILSGLKPGDLLISGPLDRLADGTRVRSTPAR